MLKQLANMTTEKLIEMFELTTNMNDENYSVPGKEQYSIYKFGTADCHSRQHSFP